MAESSTNPPRPRPRPRPVVKHVDSNASSTPGASTSSSTIPLNISGQNVVIEVNDTDEMFIRNKNRTFQTWQKLDQLNKGSGKSREGSSDSDNGSTPKKNQHKRKKQRPGSTPLWPNDPKFTRFLSHDLSDDSDSEIEILDGATPKGKRKRQQRSRSRSITPPPALPEHQIQNAKNVVRRALGAGARAPSPTFLDVDEDSGDEVTFQPELDVIAKEIAEQSNQEGSQAPVGDVQDHLTLTVKWHPHPLDPNGEEAQWEYKIDRNDSFRDLFEATAEDARILSSNLVMTYQGKRFFPSVTPAILKIWAETAELGAYDKRAYEYFQKMSHSTTPKTSTPNVQVEVLHLDTDDEEAAPGPGPHVPDSQPHESEAESEAEGETFKLTLRSAGNRDITLTVRQTTKCGAIVRAFIKKLGIADQYPSLFEEPGKAGKKGGRKGKGNSAVNKDPRLYMDGDKLENDSPIGDMDLEDGDMVDVVGL